MYKLIKLFVIGGITLFVVGCGMNNNKFGVHSADYADAKELPALKLPAGSLAASNRYDIPPVPDSNTGKIISDVMPPDYCVN